MNDDIHVDSPLEFVLSEIEIESEEEINTTMNQHIFKPMMKKYMKDFKGYVWRLADNWFSKIPCPINNQQEIKYLEIGTLCGANAISVAKTYCKGVSCQLVCIDPWLDHNDYNEYIGEQDTNFNFFLENIKNSGEEYKFTYYKNFSYQVLPTLPQNSFDMIYIDGNHSSFSVLEDAVLSFRCCKLYGIIIFDDYDWLEVKISIDSFVNCYYTKLKILGIENGQYFIQKMNN